MARLALLGADDEPLGREVLRRAAARGDAVVWLADRHDAPLDDDHRGCAAEVRTVDTADEAALGDALRGVDAVLACTRGARTGVVRRVAVARGVPSLDTDADVGAVVAAREALGPSARAAGLPVITGVRWRTVLGDLLAAVAARRLARVEQVHVAYVVPDRGGVLAAAAPAGRAGLATHLPGPVPAWVRGRAVAERLGEQRRLAWFPRPLGPHHAASAPGLEALWVPDHVRADTVRTYVAASSLRAELLQAAGNLARWGPSQRRLRSWLGRPGLGVTPETRWACVAEVSAGGAPVRGWANGRDPEGVSAGLLLALTDVVLAAPPREGGFLAPAVLAPADATLDVLTAAGALRWSVTHPERR